MKHLFFISLALLTIISCNNSADSINKLEGETNALKKQYDSLTVLQKVVEDSLQKNKSHIDSEIFVDSVMKILDEAIKPK